MSCFVNYIAFFVFFLQEIEDYFKLSRRELLRTEFAVLVALEFCCYYSEAEINSAYQCMDSLIEPDD